MHDVAAKKKEKETRDLPYCARRNVKHRRGPRRRIQTTRQESCAQKKLRVRNWIKIEERGCRPLSDPLLFLKHPPKVAGRSRRVLFARRPKPKKLKTIHAVISHRYIRTLNVETVIIWQKDVETRIRFNPLHSLIFFFFYLTITLEFRKATLQMTILFLL